MTNGRVVRSGWVGALALVALAACGVGVDADDRLSRAEQLMTRGDYGAAVLEIKNALQEKPDDPRAQLALARISIMLSNPEAAERALADAEKYGADRNSTSQLRVQLLQQKGAYQELLTTLDSDKLTLAPPARELARAQALAGLGRCGPAIKRARGLLADSATLVPARIVLAECYARARQQKLAIELLETAVREQPGSAAAWVALGRLQQLTGENAAAEQSWQQAAEHAAGELTALQQLNMETALADLQLARGDLPAARATHGRMLRVAPQGALAGLLDTRLLLAGGEYEAAVDSAREIVSHAAEFDAARVVLASALLASGQREQALAEISRLAHEHADAAALETAAKVLRENAAVPANSEDYWVSVAGAQLALGQSAMARVALDKAASVAPNSVRVATRRVQMELRSGNGPEALRRAQLLAAPDDATPLALLLLAQAQRMQHELPAALATLNRLQAKQPSAETAMLLAKVQRDMTMGSGFEPLQAWLSQHADSMPVRAMLAELLLAAGRNQDAIAEYQKLLAAAPEDPVVVNNLAWAYYLVKDVRALEMARKAYQLAPKAPSIADTFAWVSIESGAQAEGVKVLAAMDEAGQLIEPEARYHFAAGLARIGKNDEAREQVAALLREAAQFPSRKDAEVLAASLN